MESSFLRVPIRVNTNVESVEKKGRGGERCSNPHSSQEKGRRCHIRRNFYITDRAIKYLLDNEIAFYKRLAGLVQSAYVHRNLEQPLYTLFEEIAHAVCNGVTPNGPFPQTTIAIEPQYRFGPQFSVKGPQRDIKLASEIPDYVRLLRPSVDDADKIFPKEEEDKTERKDSYLYGRDTCLLHSIGKLISHPLCKDPPQRDAIDSVHQK